VPPGKTGELPSDFFDIQLRTPRARNRRSQFVDVDRRKARTAEATMDKSLPAYSL